MPDDTILERQTTTLRAIDDGDLCNARPDLCHHDDAHHEKEQLRKLDLSLIPWLSLLYLLTFLTRTNIGNAKLAHLTTSLHLSSTQYNLSLAIFFISYSLFEPVSNILLKLLKPSHYLPLLMFFCGIITICLGFVTNVTGLLIARFCLGIAQAGIFPGVNYLLSCWYKRSELGIRTAVFFSAAAVSGSFGGLFAYGLQQMNGIGKKEGWSWIFIIEGVVVVVVSILSIWMVFNFPEDYIHKRNSKRVKLIRCTEDETHHKDAPPSDTPPERHWSHTLRLCLTDWKTWTGVAIYGGAAGPLFAFSLFLPSIIGDMGAYNATTSQLLTIPPYIVGCIATLIVGYVADKTSQRGICNIVVSLFAVAGFVMLLVGNSVAVKYTGTFLAAIGIYPCIPNTVTWSSNNIQDPGKRGLALGMVIGFGNLAGVVNCFVYRQEDRPKYRLGHGVVLGFLIILLWGGSVVQHFMLLKENKKKEAHAQLELAERENRVKEVRPLEETQVRRNNDNEDSDDTFVYVV